jgi:hypothetical protein
MRSRFLSLVAIAGSVLCLGTPAFGQDVTIDFTGVANPSVQALGAYAGFYTGSVNGVTDNPGFICDDYNNEIFLPSESWQATATSFSSLVSGGSVNMQALNTTMFGSTIGLAGYAAIANLASQMAAAVSMPNSVQLQADISAAIWYIGSVNSVSPNTTVPFTSLDAGAQALVDEMLSMYGPFGSASDTDQSAIAELEGSSLWLYTPTGQDITPASDAQYLPQEFVGNVAVVDPPPVAAPEGGAPLMYLLLAGAACFGAMYFRFRSQPVRQLAA